MIKGVQLYIIFLNLDLINKEIIEFRNKYKYKYDNK